MNKFGARVTADRLPQLIKSLHALAARRVMVGIPASRDSREDGSPISNAEIGYIQEFGAPEANIPPRPFLVPGVESAQDQIVSRLRRAGAAATRNDQTGVEQQLNAAGITGQTAVRVQMTDGDFEPLKAATLAARRSRGRTGTHPLIDTGQLRNSITYVLRDARAGASGEGMDAAPGDGAASKVHTTEFHGQEGRAATHAKSRAAKIAGQEDFAEASSEGLDVGDLAVLFF